MLHIGIYNKPKYFENLYMFVLYFNIPGTLEVEDKAFSPEYSGLLLVVVLFVCLFFSVFYSFMGSRPLNHLAVDKWDKKVMHEY